MSDDANGNATRPPSPLPVTGQTADAPQVNVPIDDIYASLTRRYMRDGRAPMLGDIPMNGHRATGAADGVAPQDYVTLSQLQGLLSEIYGIPTGRLVIATGMQVEEGYVIANGQSLSRANYPALWAYAQASGNLAASHGSRTAGQYSPGNGSTTFAVPNLYADGGYFIRPISSGRGIGTVQDDEMRSHQHNATFSGNELPPHNHPGEFLRDSSGNGNKFGNGPWDFGTMTAASAGTPSGSVTVSATGGTETRPKNIAFPVLIKT